MKRNCAIALTIFVMVFSLVACGKSEYATKTEEMISGIGEVTLNSKDAIDAAQNQYNALTDKDKAKVENYSVLEDAVKKYEALQKEQSNNTKDELESVVLKLQSVDANCDTLVVIMSNNWSGVSSYFDEKWFNSKKSAFTQQFREECETAYALQKQIPIDMAEITEDMKSLNNIDESYKTYYDAVKALYTEEISYSEFAVSYPEGYSHITFNDKVTTHRDTYTRLLSDINLAK